MADPHVAGFRFEAGAEGGTVQAVAPGSTWLTLLTFGAESVVNCEVLVE